MGCSMFLTISEVAARYSVSRTSIWRWLKTDQNFPKPIQIAKATLRWRVSDLEAWESAQAKTI